MMIIEGNALRRSPSLFASINEINPKGNRVLYFPYQQICNVEGNLPNGHYKITIEQEGKQLLNIYGKLAQVRKFGEVGYVIQEEDNPSRLDKIPLKNLKVLVS